MWIVVVVGSANGAIALFWITGPPELIHSVINSIRHVSVSEQYLQRMKKNVCIKVWKSKFSSTYVSICALITVLHWRKANGPPL